tara:strand:+ start:3058 stop:3447 length:390 start_codon:yes stop_codon:yes gene_type:complete
MKNDEISESGKLLPCPFCGGEAGVTASDLDGFEISCKGECVASCGYVVFDTDKDAIKAWNTRTPVVNEKLTTDKHITSLEKTVASITKRLNNSDSSLLVKRNRELEQKLEDQSILVGQMALEIVRLRGS